MAIDVHDELRPLMFSIAYRMLGSVGEAEDVVQEAFLRLHAQDGVRSPKAFLTTVTTRLAIDELRSARARREQYVGEWLPEPLVEERGYERVEEDDTLSLAFLVLLESLGPLERAVFLLHDVFDYGYDEIAEAVGRSEDACRQIVARARRRVEERRPRFEPSREQRDELARRFFDAVEAGDGGAIEELLADGALMVGDGGGKAPALARALRGRERVARFLATLAPQGRRMGLALERVLVNGQPGLVARDREGRVASVLALDVADGAVQAVRAVLNPDKLGHLGPVADLKALLRSRSR